MRNSIAHTKLIGVTAEGEKQEIEIKIGVPYKINHEDNIEEWACPVSLQPLFSQLHDAHGIDSLQAMCLAINLVIDLLAAYKEKGGKLFLEGGDEFPHDAYWFSHAKDTCHAKFTRAPNCRCTWINVHYQNAEMMIPIIVAPISISSIPIES